MDGFFFSPGDPQIFGYLFSAALLALFWLYRNGQEASAPRIRWIAAVALLLVSVYTRILTIEQTFGLYNYEELAASLVHVNRLLNHQWTWTGATQIVYVALLDAWRFLFGLEAVAVRALSATLGFGAMIFAYFAVARMVNARIGLLTAGVLGVGVYSSFFSKLAIETAWTLFFVSLSLFLYVNIRGSNRRLKWYFAIGLCAACGVFTYPGYTLWLLACVPFVAWEIYRAYGVNVRAAVKPGLLLLAGFALITSPAVFFHFTYQESAPLFKGGGGFLTGDLSYWESLTTHLRDIFYYGRSYHLVFMHMGFIEAALWGFFIVGAISLLERRAGEPWARVLFGSMWLLIFLSERSRFSVTSAFPPRVFQ